MARGAAGDGVVVVLEPVLEQAHRAVVRDQARDGVTIQLHGCLRTWSVRSAKGKRTSASPGRASAASSGRQAAAALPWKSPNGSVLGSPSSGEIPSAAPGSRASAAAKPCRTGRCDASGGG